MLGFIVDFVKTVAGGLLVKKGGDRSPNPGVKIKIEQDNVVVSDEKSANAISTKLQDPLADIEAMKAAANRKLQTAMVTAASMKKAAAKKKRTVKAKVVKNKPRTSTATAAKLKRTESKLKRNMTTAGNSEEVQPEIGTKRVSKPPARFCDLDNTTEIQTETKRVRKPPARFCDSMNSTGIDSSKNNNKLVEVAEKRKVGWPKGKPRKKWPTGKLPEKKPKGKVGWPKGKPKKKQPHSDISVAPKALSAEEARSKPIANKKRTTAATAARMRKVLERRERKAEKALERRERKAEKVEEEKKAKASSAEAARLKTIANKKRTAAATAARMRKVLERRASERRASERRASEGRAAEGRAAEGREREVEAMTLVEKAAEVEDDKDTDINVSTTARTKRKRRPPLRYCETDAFTGGTNNKKKNSETSETSEEARLKRVKNKKSTAAVTAVRMKKQVERKMEAEVEASVTADKVEEEEAGSKKKRKLEHGKHPEPAHTSTATAHSKPIDDGKSVHNNVTTGVATSSPMKNVKVDQPFPSNIGNAPCATPQQKQEDQQWLEYLDSYRRGSPHWSGMRRNQIPTNTPIVNAHQYSTTPVQNTYWYSQRQQQPVPWSNLNQATYAPRPAYSPNMNQRYNYILPIPSNGTFQSRAQKAIQQPVMKQKGGSPPTTERNSNNKINHDTVKSNSKGKIVAESENSKGIEVTKVEEKVKQEPVTKQKCGSPSATERNPHNKINHDTVKSDLKGKIVAESENSKGIEATKAEEEVKQEPVTKQKGGSPPTTERSLNTKMNHDMVLKADSKGKIVGKSENSKGIEATKAEGEVKQEPISETKVEPKKSAPQEGAVKEHTAT